MQVKGGKRIRIAELFFRVTMIPGSYAGGSTQARSRGPGTPMSSGRKRCWKNSTAASLFCSARPADRLGTARHSHGPPRSSGGGSGSGREPILRSGTITPRSFVASGGSMYGSPGVTPQASPSRCPVRSTSGAGACTALACSRAGGRRIALPACPPDRGGLPRTCRVPHRTGPRVPFWSEALPSRGRLGVDCRTERSACAPRSEYGASLAGWCCLSRPLTCER